MIFLRTASGPHCDLNYTVSHFQGFQIFDHSSICEHLADYCKRTEVNQHTCCDPYSNAAINSDA